MYYLLTMRYLLSDRNRSEVGIGVLVDIFIPESDKESLKIYRLYSSVNAISKARHESELTPYKICKCSTKPGERV